jgi:hypothetical protein
MRMATCAVHERDRLSVDLPQLSACFRSVSKVENNGHISKKGQQLLSGDARRSANAHNLGVAALFTKVEQLVRFARTPISIQSVLVKVISNPMARKHSKHAVFEDAMPADEGATTPTTCWLCGRPTGKTIVWHHPVPKSRGGRDTVPMHPICQQTLIANFTNTELQRHGMDVAALLSDPNVRKFVDWVAKKDPDFTASTTKKQR